MSNEGMGEEAEESQPLTRYRSDVAEDEEGEVRWTDHFAVPAGRSNVCPAKLPVVGTS
jgi:hypothetical protein